MSVENPARTPGVEWMAIIGKNGTKEIAAAFASNAVLETSVMNGPCVGAEVIASVFAAVGGGMYNSLAFTSETRPRLTDTTLDGRGSGGPHHPQRSGVASL